MINRAGVVIASEVIRGMPELSCNPVSLHLRLRFPSLIHCSRLLVIPGANEEAVIDPRGQRPLCSAGSYQRGLASAPGFKPSLEFLVFRPPPQSTHVSFFFGFPSAPSEGSCSPASRDERERWAAARGSLAPPEDPGRPALCNPGAVLGQSCVGHSWRGR